jgi:hypothetical protein
MMPGKPNDKTSNATKASQETGDLNPAKAIAGNTNQWPTNSSSQI